MAESAPVAGTFFARRATGFVRDIKVRDAVIFNVLPACPGLVMAVSVFWILSAFSGVNIYACIAITVVCSFLISGAFGLLSQVMPRSGADYILISRSLHPALGIGSSILIGASSMLAMGYWGVFTAKICIGPMLTMVGVSADSSTLQDWGQSATGKGWSFVIGIAEIAILCAIMMIGMRLMMRIQGWLFGLGMAGFILAALELIFTSRSSFISSYNDYARPFTHRADTYHYFIAQAKTAGVAVGGATDWHNTIVASGAIIAFGVWVWFSTNLAGEIRQAGTRRNWYSMLSGLAITFGSVALMVALLYHTVGQDFLTAVNGVPGRPEGLHAAERAVVDHARGRSAHEHAARHVPRDHVLLLGAADRLHPDRPARPRAVRVGVRPGHPGAGRGGQPAPPHARLRARADRRLQHPVALRGGLRVVVPEVRRAVHDRRLPDVRAGRHLGDRVPVPPARRLRGLRLEDRLPRAAADGLVRRRARSWPACSAPGCSSPTAASACRTRARASPTSCSRPPATVGWR